jgi:hypothetical protein
MNLIIDPTSPFFEQMQLLYSEEEDLGAKIAYVLGIPANNISITRKE